jgi:hypothetical protein
MKKYSINLIRLIFFLLQPILATIFIVASLLFLYKSENQLRLDLLAAFIFLSIPFVILPLIIFINYFIHDQFLEITQPENSKLITITRKDSYKTIEKDKIQLIIERSYQSTSGWSYCKYWTIYYGNEKFVISSLPINDSNFYKLFCDNKFKRISKFIPIISPASQPHDSHHEVV